MKKALIGTLACLFVSVYVSGVSADTIDSLGEDMNNGKLSISGSGLEANDKILVEIFDVSGGSIDYTDGIDFAGVFEADDSGSYDISFFMPDSVESGEKEIFVKPLLAQAESMRLEYYNAKDVSEIVQNWNEAISDKDKDKMEKLINSATALEIILNTDMAEELATELSGTDKTTLVEELLKLNTVDSISDFSEDFKKLYLNFAVNNLSDENCKELLKRFYDEIDTVRKDVYTDIVQILDKDELFMDAAKSRKNGSALSNSETVSLVYDRAVLMKFKQINYYTGIHPFMEKYNADYFKVDFSGYNKLKNTYPVDSGLINKKGSYSDFDTLRSIFNSLVETEAKAEAASEQKVISGGSSGSSGGSGGSGGSSSSGSSVKPSSQSGSVIMPQTIYPVYETVFDDLEDYEWAEEGILALYNAGVVDGVEKKIFAPAADVTREQFVKMISALIDMPQSPDKSGFSDIEEGEWYEKYIDAAKHVALINGREDGSFGIGEKITRQDAAVICVNAIKIAKPDMIEGLTLEEPSFTDSEEISSYAVYAVSALKTLGILNGDETGRVKPLSGASRAEAAVMISRVLSLIK